jgi:transposase InsO family protein
MSWKSVSEMDEKLRFIADCLSGMVTMTDLCARYGISRQTGYELKRRYAAEGLAGLAARSRAPHRHGRATSPALVERIVELRRSKPHWGPKKLLAVLQRSAPDEAWPGHATVSQIVRQAGLAKPRQASRHRVAVDQPFAAVEAANDTWCIDFKGWFETADAIRCDPFTVTDALSRYLLDVRIMAPTAEPVEACMDALFQEHGVPLAIRSDNGPPFASTGAGGLTRLSARWAKMGIRLERIRPGTPQQNGRHERMHRTLKAEACQPPAADAAEQQRRFDAFRHEYNFERPHEALNQRSPAQLYQNSPRRFFEPKGDPDYGQDEVRRVRSGGEIKWDGGMLYVSDALIGEAVGITECEGGDCLVRFANVRLGLIDRRTGKLARFGPGRPPRTEARSPNPNPKLSGM